MYTSDACFDHPYYRDKHKRLIPPEGYCVIVPYLRSYASLRALDQVAVTHLARRADRLVCYRS